MGLFGPEKMTLELERFDFKPGDIIRGTVYLSLDKPTKSRKLAVSLLGKMRSSHRDSDGDIHSQDQTVYDFTLPLDGEREYRDGQYIFEIKIPSDILQMNQAGQLLQSSMEEKLGGLGSILGKVMTGQRPVRWMVQAYLDIPMKLDVKKSQDIVISQE